MTNGATSRFAPLCAGAGLVLAHLLGGAPAHALPSTFVTASSVHSDDYLAAYAFDGDPQTRWASRDHGQPAWVQLDFEKSVAVDHVIIHWERACAVEYTVEFSDDARTWRTARRITDGQPGRAVLSALSAQGRYFRIVGLKPGPFGILSIWDVEFPEPQVQAALADLRRAAEEGQRQRLRGALAGVVEDGARELVFAVRHAVSEHWYANFSYYAADGHSYFGNENKLYRDGGRLCRLDLGTGQVKVLLDDPRGGVRDPQVHYDGHTILFAYRKGGTEHYNLHEIQADGTGLRQITDGPWDDIEPSYLPDGGIVFASSRCKRWVNCWLTQVAILYRCDGDGGNLRPLSSNNEHDNTPWPLPDGRILYTRWEYVDRSQVDYHHLWVVSPDGTGQMTFYGNLHPGVVMIDAKPIPDSETIVACFSPGHGQTEHEGAVAIVDPRLGPDAPQSARRISCAQDLRDPWAFSERLFLAAQRHGLVLLDDSGDTLEIYRLPSQDIQAGLQCHEPRPLVTRAREARIAPRVDAAKPSGSLLLANVYDGRNMAGVAPGEIKKLLVSI